MIRWSQLVNTIYYQRSVLSPMEYVLFILLALVLLLIFTNIRIVPQASQYVIEFLGKYKTTWSAGLHVKIPFLERISKRITLKEQVLDSPPQPVITKDNVTMQIDTVVYYRIFDAKLYTYGVVNPVNALANLTATTLRNLVGELELDGTLTSRDTINGKMTAILDEATDQWGIRMLREAGADPAVLELKKYDALVRMADGRASKIIVPTDAVQAVTRDVLFSEASGLGDATAPDTTPDPVVVKPDPCCDGD